MAEEAPLIGPAFLARLERLEWSLRRLERGEPRGDAPVRKRGAGLLFEDHRPYTPGDDLRHLDWNAYLRLGELLVRQNAAEESPRLCCILDCSASMGARDEAKLRALAEIAAALSAVALLRNTSVVLLASPGGGGVSRFRGRHDLKPLLDRLGSLRVQAGAGFLSDRREVQEILETSHARGVAVAVSDFFGDGTEIAELARLRQRGFLVHAVELSDRRDLTVVPGDSIVLVDAETGRKRRERIDAKAAAEYEDTLRAHRGKVAVSLAGHRILHARHEIDDPVETLVVGLIRKSTLVA